MKILLVLEFGAPETPIPASSDQRRAGNQSQLSLLLTAKMSSFQPGSTTAESYVEPTPMPDHVPKVEELGVTSAPLKSAAFFIGTHCQKYNGMKTPRDNMNE